MLAVWEEQKPQSVAPRDPDLARVLSTAAGLSVESGFGGGYQSGHAGVPAHARSAVPSGGTGRQQTDKER